MRSADTKARNRAATIRRTVLCTLAVQNACQMLSMRYSRLPSQPKYLSSTAVVSAEVVKIVLSFVALVAQQGMPAAQLVWQSVFVQWRDTLLVGVPALLYLIQNNLLYVATSHLDAATCQVAYQLKLLTTAFFTVTLLKRHISNKRWASLGLLFLGVVLVQAPKQRSPTGAVQQPVLGMAAVTAACLLSGLAGVWLERIVKRTSDVPIWVSDVPLAPPPSPSPSRPPIGKRTSGTPSWLRSFRLHLVSLVLWLDVHASHSLYISHVSRRGRLARPLAGRTLTLTLALILTPTLTLALILTPTLTLTLTLALTQVRNIQLGVVSLVLGLGSVCTTCMHLTPYISPMYLAEVVSLVLGLGSVWKIDRQPVAALDMY